MCLMGRKQLSHGIREKTTKNQQLTLKIHVSVVCTCTFWYGTTHGPAQGPARQSHGPAHVIAGPDHVEPVIHRPRCHFMGPAGPCRAETFEKMMSRAVPGRAGP